MSKAKRKTSKRSTPAGTTSVPQVGIKPAEGTVENEKIASLLNQLVNKCILMTLDVATDECKCKFYKHAKEIARIVRELYALRGET